MKSDERRWKPEKLGEIECDELASNRVGFRLSVVSVHESQLVTVNLRESQAIARDVSKGTQLGCGKVEFCLPTKLRAPPSLADRVIGRARCALNAFGLFSRPERGSR